MTPYYRYCIVDVEVLFNTLYFHEFHKKLIHEIQYECWNVLAAIGTTKNICEYLNVKYQFASNLWK